MPHKGNMNASSGRADEAARLAEMLAGCSWRDRDGAVRPVGRDGLLVVTRISRRSGPSRTHWRAAA